MLSCRKHGPAIVGVGRGSWTGKKAVDSRAHCAPAPLPNAHCLLSTGAAFVQRRRRFLRGQQSKQATANMESTANLQAVRLPPHAAGHSPSCPLWNRSWTRSASCLLHLFLQPLCPLPLIRACWHCWAFGGRGGWAWVCITPSLQRRLAKIARMFPSGPRYRTSTSPNRWPQLAQLRAPYLAPLATLCNSSGRGVVPDLDPTSARFSTLGRMFVLQNVSCVLAG